MRVGPLIAVAVASLAWSPSQADARTWEPPVPLPWAVVIHAECPDGGGSCANPAAGVVYLEPGAGRFALMHELGHIYLERLDGFWKGAIMDHLGYDPARVAWSTGATGDECAPSGKAVCPDEVAADAYAACALRMVPGGRLVGRGSNRRRVGRWDNHYGYLPTRRRHRRVCNVIRRSSRGSPRTAPSHAAVR